MTKEEIRYDLAAIVFVAAGVLAYNGLAGWGWFLFVGLLVMP